AVLTIATKYRAVQIAQGMRFPAPSASRLVWRSITSFSDPMKRPTTILRYLESVITHRLHFQVAANAREILLELRCYCRCDDEIAAPGDQHVHRHVVEQTAIDHR